MNVCVDKCGHQELTIKSVHNTAMSRNNVSEVLNIRFDEITWHLIRSIISALISASIEKLFYLDLKCPFETTCEKSSKRSNDRSKDGHEKCVDQNRIDRDRFLHSHL